MTQIAVPTVPRYRPQTSKLAPPPLPSSRSSSLRDPADGSRDTHLRTPRPNIIVLTSVGLSTPLAFHGSQNGGLATHARGMKERRDPRRNIRICLAGIWVLRRRDLGFALQPRRNLVLYRNYFFF
ncbi:uncharacterized protein LOC21394250 [Morus notabilis]|uniref:uncharacterized protein LOC21394250 n=1 Tax=Morus notabilis TaxID=981085 RepID=UPI000CED29CD|nr:uncharacterized protein LOC21394250 [Morus notabilis]